MKNICLTLILFTFSQIVNAQIGDVIHYNENIEYQNDFDFSKKDLYQKINDLALKITEHSNTKKDQVKSIYLWLCKNIGYDYELRHDVKLQKQYYTSEEHVVEKVLERKLALCGGVSFLFERLCYELGIEAETIHGYTDKTTNFDKPSHSWNAVKINDNWHLLDITWSQNETNIDEPDLYWYLTQPELFWKTHFPLEQNWTLLNNTINIEQFKQINNKKAFQ